MEDTQALSLTQKDYNQAVAHLNNNTNLPWTLGGKDPDYWIESQPEPLYCKASEYKKEIQENLRQFTEFYLLFICEVVTLNPVRTSDSEFGQNKATIRLEDKKIIKLLSQNIFKSAQETSEDQNTSERLTFEANTPERQAQLFDRLSDFLTNPQFNPSESKKYRVSHRLN